MPSLWRRSRPAASAAALTEVASGAITRLETGWGRKVVKEEEGEAKEGGKGRLSEDGEGTVQSDLYCNLRGTLRRRYRRSSFRNRLRN